MATQRENAEIFAGLHISGNPIVLFNIWDAGGARAVAEAGAQAIATGSHSVAAANAYDDGEQVPFDFAAASLERIVASVDLPVTLDFEGGYAVDAAGLKLNIAKVIAAGAVGINFEDQIVGGGGLYSIEEQSARILAIRVTADESDIPLFINARCDLFLKNGPDAHADYVEAALKRAAAYAEAGARGFFAPGLKDAELIKRICARSPLPINIMVMPETPSNTEMAALGVARISYGPGPYRRMMEHMTASARTAFS